MAFAPQTFTIPPEFQSELEPAELLDTRTDAEMIDSLSNYTPVTSEKNIWAFWHLGTSGMPAWCLRNVIAWARINGPTWTLRILNSDPTSPNHLSKFVPTHMLPAAITNNNMTGPFTGQHTADFVRTATIYLHGGCFIDVGILLIRRLDRICWDKLTAPNSPYGLAIPTLRRENIANHFVACRRGDPFIHRWHSLMMHLWHDRTESKGTIIAHPLLQIVLHNDDASVREPLGWDFTDPITILEYVGQILAFQRMAWCDKADEEGFNCAEYFANHILFFDAMQENWAAEVGMKMVGPHPRMMELLAMDREERGKDAEEASRMVWRMLTRSSMMKVTSAKGMSKTPHLGELWSREENQEKDCGIGTWAELLRYGSVHWKQKREGIVFVDPGTLEGRVKKTLFEDSLITSQNVSGVQP